MKKQNLKKDFIAVIATVTLLSGCSLDTQTQYQDMTDISISSDVEEESNQPSLAKLTLLNTKPEMDGNTLLYGKLHITLPDDVTVEQQESDEDAIVIDFIGAESIKSEEGYGKSGPFPPRVWLANYHAEYENEWELASALLDLLPDSSLHIRYGSDNQYGCLFTYDKPYKSGYVLVYEDDIYVVEEISVESDYSFGGLIDDKAVMWESDIHEIGDRNNHMCDKICDKIKVEEDSPFLVMQIRDTDDIKKVCLFRDGYFSSPDYEFAFTEWSGKVEFEDCNFDGCLDMAVSPTIFYLWNADKKEYEEAQMPEKFPEYSWKTKRFPQTKTVWGYDDEYVKNADGTTSWDSFDHMEMLWRWEGTALVKKRECVAEVRDEGVRIWAYEYEGSRENMLFDETFTLEEWKQNSVKVQKRYEQFYGEMLPKEYDESLHKIDYNQERREYIPQELLDTITKTMLDKTELETFKGFVNDIELTRDEVLVLAKDNLALRYDVIVAERSGDYIMVMTDGDNDGIQDIVAEEYFGGSAGFTEYVFYKGQQDGTYQRTSSYDSVKQEFAIISYEGKNYLCCMLYDYGKKIHDGMRLACYVDGSRAETVDLKLFPEKYDIKLKECANEKYRAFAEDIFENSLSFKEMIDEHKNINGSSEEKSPLEEQYEYQCDLDNDGAAEQYNKSIWEPSNMGTHECIHFYGEGEGIENTYNAMSAAVGTPIMMWVEQYEEKNIINVISLTGLDDFEITGFLVNGTEYERIYRITADVTYGCCSNRT